MTTFLASPVSADSHHLTFHNRRSVTNTVDAATMNSDSYLTARQGSSSADRPPSAWTESKRVLPASVPESQAQPSNVQLTEMLKKVHEELSLHRFIMTEIQSRIAKLEHTTSQEVQASSPPASFVTHKSCPPSAKKVGNVGRAGRSSRGAYTDYAPRLSTDTMATHPHSGFLRMPRCFSGIGFDFNFDALKQRLDTPPRTPDASDSARLMLAVELGQVPKADVTTRRSSKHSATNRSRSSVPRLPPKNWDQQEEESDIVEHIKELNSKCMPRPPIFLQPVPRNSRSKVVLSSHVRGDSLAALPAMQSDPSTKNSVRSFSTNLKSLILCTSVSREKQKKSEEAVYA